MNAREDIAFLVGSQNRLDIVRRLAESPGRPTEIARACGCARETAQRTLRGLVDRGWVIKEGSAYHLSRGGELVLQGYEDLESVVETVDRLEQFLTHAGALGAALPREFLDSVVVTSTTSESPHDALNRFLTVLGDEPVDRFLGVAPIVSQVFNRGAERVIAPETSVGLIVDESVLTTSREEFPEALERAHRMDNMDLYVAAAPLEYGLAVVEDRAYLGAYDDAGNLVASVDSDDEAFVHWTEERYEQLRASATRVEPSPEPDETTRKRESSDGRGGN